METKNINGFRCHQWWKLKNGVTVGYCYDTGNWHTDDGQLFESHEEYENKIMNED